MHAEHGDSFVSFRRAPSRNRRTSTCLSLPWSAKQQARFEAMAVQSLEDQRAIEASDTMPFDVYRQEYTSPSRLGRAAYEPVPLEA